METNGFPGESPGSPPAARTGPGEIEETPGTSLDSPREGKAEQQTIEEIPIPTEPRDPVDALRRASVHSPLSKKNEADPDSQEMRTGAGNHEEALRAKNSYLECAYQAGG